MLFLTSFSILVSVVCGAVLPLQERSLSVTSTRAPNLPLILWHGLGDASGSEGIQAIGKLYQEIYPGSFVYYVHIGDNDDADRHASFFGNLTEQVNSVCDDIRKTKELQRVDGVNALGFSQGGVFLRGLVERCDAIDVKNLVTFGSPHSGITTFAECADGDWWCKIWSGTLKGHTWDSFAQSTLVPAQYFRDPEDIDNFLEYSNFLADINNEREEKADIYKKRIAALDLLVLYKFQDEEVLHPPESSWFADSNTTSGLLTRLKERNMYKEDWLGLRKLDEKGGIIFRTTPGKHMQIEDGALEDAFSKYFAFQVKRHDSETWFENSHTQMVLGDRGPLLTDAKQRGGSLARNGVAEKHELKVPQPSTRIMLLDFLERYADEISQTLD